MHFRDGLQGQVGGMGGAHGIKEYGQVSAAGPANP